MPKTRGKVDEMESKCVLGIVFICNMENVANFGGDIKLCLCVAC